MEVPCAITEIEKNIHYIKTKSSGEVYYFVLCHCLWQKGEHTTNKHHISQFICDYLSICTQAEQLQQRNNYEILTTNVTCWNSALSCVKIENNNPNQRANSWTTDDFHNQLKKHKVFTENIKIINKFLRFVVSNIGETYK